MYKRYAQHFSLEFGIEVPTEKDKLRDAKIQVYNEKRKLILEENFPLKYTPIIAEKKICLNEEDEQTLVHKTTDILEKLCFD